MSTADIKSIVSAAHHAVCNQDAIERSHPHVYATTIEAKTTLRPEVFHLRRPSCDFWRIPYGDIAYWYFKTEEDLNAFKDWASCQPHS